MTFAPLAKLRQSVVQLKTWDWVLTLLAVYVVHYFFVNCFIVGDVTDLLKPFRKMPLYIYTG